MNKNTLDYNYIALEMLKLTPPHTSQESMRTYNDYLDNLIGYSNTIEEMEKLKAENIQLNEELKKRNIKISDTSISRLRDYIKSNITNMDGTVYDNIISTLTEWMDKVK